MNFYNDNDSYVAQWLGNLIAARHLPQGTVDARSIVEIDPEELRSFRQCHFFAGIGGWPYALSLACWPADREVWTASCPCQPLSSAGQRRGHADERHLWPALFRLVAECRPSVVFGEQVASKDGREWLAGVRADLEALGYAVGAADLCAAGVGASHIRQRLFWVAHADERLSRQGSTLGGGRNHRGDAQQGTGSSCGGGAEWLGHALSPRLEERAGERRDDEPQRAPAERDGRTTGGLAHTNSANGIKLRGYTGSYTPPAERSIYDPWADADWLPCLDGKARRIEPGTFPLAHGVPNRVGRLRGYGNAIVPQVAAEFVRAFMEIGT